TSHVESRRGRPTGSPSGPSVQRRCNRVQPRATTIRDSGGATCNPPSIGGCTPRVTPPCNARATPSHPMLDPTHTPHRHGADTIGTPGQAEARRAQQRERKKRYLRRQANGAAVLKVDVSDYNALVAMLIDTGWLREVEALDRHQVEIAVAALLGDAAAGLK